MILAAEDQPVGVGSPNPYAGGDRQVDSQLEELREKINSATEQILAGNVTDGELVFEQLQAKLRDEYGLE